MSNERSTLSALNFGDAPAAAPIMPPPAPSQLPSVQASPSVPSAPIREVTQEDVDRLGEGSAQAMQTVSDRMLSLQRAGDAGELGQHLNQIVIEAKGLDPASLQNKGLMKKFIGKVLGVKENLLGQFDTVKGRIDALVAQMDREVAVQSARVKDLDDLYNANIAYYHGLKDAQEKGNAMLTTLQATIAQVEAQAATDSFATNRLADLKDREMVLSKRIDDFGRAALLAEQAGPAIMIQKQNARQLVETFKDLKSTTIPAWQGVFTQYLISLDQARGAQLATNISNATDEAIRKSADLLGQNARSIAEARQRSVVSLETLQYNQNKLFETIDAVKAIEEKGKQDRAAAAPQLKQLEQALINRLAPNVNRS